METWVVFDLLLRGGAVWILFACGVLFSTNPSNDRKSLSVSVLCGVLIAYLLVSSPALLLPGWLVWLLVLLAGTAPICVYWASVEIFLDAVDIAPWQLVAGGLIVLGAWFSSVIPFAGLVRGALVIALFCHLLYLIIASAEGDLVEERRKFRRWFLFLVTCLVLLITTLEILDVDDDLSHEFFTLHAAAFLFMSLIFLVWSVRVTSDVWVKRPHLPLRESVHSPADIALAKKAQAALEGGIWREEGLTIGTLANRLGAKEHNVRRAINGVLGYRNFPAFVNGYRVDEAKRMLGDLEMMDRAILTVAYDVGFASLGPFNRAFRQITGLSPSEYRRSKIDTEINQ